ncbi:peptidyl-tRNA hydrolase [Amia ocellicauda]|uniref:peptidyl-tRNA hydrolase n=1 Tax=Amia ocellicauda TaxID=2972642 RepID=UPI0034648201
MCVSFMLQRVLQPLTRLFRGILSFSMRRWVTSIINRVLLYEPLSLKMSTDVPQNHKMRQKMVVGLGNPGMSGTRHSVGMAALAALAGRLGVAELWRGDRQVSGEVVLSELGETRLVLLRPRLLMNINGVSVAKAAAKFHIQPEDIYLLHDELDKPLGKVSMKQGGSARGHNGVRSCVECLKTDVMPRVRIGISRPAGKVSVERYVLGRFTREEQEVLREVLEQSVELLLRHIIDSGTDTALQHTKVPPGGRAAEKT